MRVVSIIALMFGTQLVYAQQADVDIALAGSQRCISLSGYHDWQFGKRKKLFVGVGARLSFYSGKDQYYVTAPAKLTSGERGPQVFFIPNITRNMDSLLVGKPAVLLSNIFLDLGYRFSDRLAVGFNIDLIGFSNGTKIRGTYINGDQRISVGANVSHFNVLLVSDNDIGSLNSELYAKYRLTDKLRLKAGFQFLFTEYKSDFKVQQSPEPNDRFRRKSLMAMVGICF